MHCQVASQVSDKHLSANTWFLVRETICTMKISEEGNDSLAGSDMRRPS